MGSWFVAPIDPAYHRVVKSKGLRAMLDLEGQRNFLEQAHSLWVKPKLDKRWPGGVPQGF